MRAAVGVALQETAGWHEPILDEQLLVDHGRFMVFFYDLDMFDLPALPDCLTQFVTSPGDSLSEW